MAGRTAVLIALMALGSAAPLAAQELKVPDFVVLPGEYATPKNETRPPVSIKQVSPCVEDEPDLRQRAAELLATESSVERESTEIDSLGEALKASDVALRGERDIFDALKKDLDDTDKALKERQSSVKRLGEDSTTKERVAEYNAAVDVYNAAVRKRNVQVAEVRRAQTAFSKKVAAHNAKVREQHARIDAFNAQTASYNPAAKAFLKDVQSFDSGCLEPGEQ